MATTPTEVTWQKMQRMLTCLLEATEVVRIANSRRQQTTDLLDEAIHVSSAHWARHEALVAAHTRVAARRTELDKLRADVAGAQREISGSGPVSIPGRFEATADSEKAAGH
ncbi:unnamed protein product [Closterium sp. NIES-53]